MAMAYICKRFGEGNNIFAVARLSNGGECRQQASGLFGINRLNASQGSR